MEGVKMAMVPRYTHTLWNAVNAGDMVMDGSCSEMNLKLPPRGDHPLRLPPPALPISRPPIGLV